MQKEREKKKSMSYAVWKLGSTRMYAAATNEPDHKFGFFGVFLHVWRWERAMHKRPRVASRPLRGACVCVCVWFPHTDGGVCLPPSLSHVLQSCSIISHECRQACFFNCPVPRRLKRISRDFMALHQFLMPCCNSGPYTLFMGTVCYSGTNMS